jgi:hypothetical protein
MDRAFTANPQTTTAGADQWGDDNEKGLPTVLTVHRPSSVVNAIAGVHQLSSGYSFI